MTLPGYEAQRIEAMEWAYSVKKQSDYDTAVLDADLTQAHPIKEISIGQVTKELRSDRETIGKGHEYPTQVWEVARDTRFTRAFDGSSDILGWLFAFGCGKIQSTQQGVSAAYLHKLTLFDPAVETTSQLPVTTIVEKVTAATALKRSLLSMAVVGITVSAEGFEHLSVSADFIGSGKTENSSLTMPGLVSAHYLASNAAVIKLGDASEDISTRVRSWSIALANNPKEGRGYFPSSGLYRGRLEVGARTIVPSLVVDLSADSDLLDDFLANTEIALEILAEGDVISGTYKHSIKFTFPNMQYQAVLIEEDEGMLTYALSFDENTVLYNSGSSDPPASIEVVNTIPAYLLASS